MQQDSMITGLTKQGMNQSTSSNWVEKKKIYTKKGLQAEGVKNYQLLMNLGVGVKVLSVDLNKGMIEMEGGHTIQAIVMNKIVGKEGLILIWKELIKIRQIMISNQLAHTDIKPGNVAVKFLSQDLRTFRAFLIDNEGTRRYGEDRNYWTEGVNRKQSKQSKKQIPQICNKETDNMGWQYMYKYMGLR